MKRIVRLLDQRELTPDQRYQRSPKGKAARARYRKKIMADPTRKSRELAYVQAWREAHRLQIRVYNRIIMRRLRREKANNATT